MKHILDLKGRTALVTGGGQGVGRQLVDEVVGPLGGDVHNPTANARQPPGIPRINHVDRHPRVAADVTQLLRPLERVDEDALAVGVDPDLRQVRGSVRHQCGDLAKGRFAQQFLQTR